MKNILISVLVLGMAAAMCPLCCAEDIVLQLDDREWGLGYNAENDTSGIQEYVLKGETVDNWSELVTAQAFFGLQKKTTPEEFMNSMIGDIKEKCPNLEWSVINKNEKDIMFDWEIKGLQGQDDQYEIDRIISGATAIWYLHYVTKKLPIQPAKREEWKRLLGSAVLRS